MKKLFSVAVAVLLALCMSICVFAADEIEIPLDAEHVGASSSGGPDALTIENGTLTANDIALFSLVLPENVPLGDTVVVHLKGTSDGDFRVWLLGAGETDEKGSEATFSNQWKASENGAEFPGEFEKYIELTAEDYDGQSLTEADRLALKGPSFGTNLSNTKLTYVGIVYGTVADLEADAVAEAQPFADAAAAALETAKSAEGSDALNAALADAQAAVDSLTEKAASGFPGVNALLSDAKNAVKEIEKLIEASAAGDALAAVQADIDTVNNALTAAKDANGDVAAIQAALDEAKAAAAKIDEAANAADYKELKAASKSASATVTEIEGVLKDAEEAVKKAEAAKKAEEEAAAAAKKKTTTIVIVVIVVVVVIAVIAAVLLKGKKKK